MPTIVDICKMIEVQPNEEKQVTVYVVPPAKQLFVKELSIFFPMGTNFDVEVWVLWGRKIQRPTDGSYRGDGNTINVPVEDRYWSGQEIEVKVKNNNTTETKRVLVRLWGELV